MVIYLTIYRRKVASEGLVAASNGGGCVDTEIGRRA